MSQKGRGRTEDRQFGKEEEKFIDEFVSFLDEDSEIRSNFVRYGRTNFCLFHT